MSAQSLPLPSESLQDQLKDEVKEESAETKGLTRVEELEMEVKNLKDQLNEKDEIILSLRKELEESKRAGVEDSIFEESFINDKHLQEILLQTNLVTKKLGEELNKK